MNAGIRDWIRKSGGSAVLIVLVLIVAGCAPKVNAPTDVQAIKDTQPAFDKAWNAGNADQVVSAFYTADAIRMETFQPAYIGQDAIRAALQKNFDAFTNEGRDIAEDVRISGDLAVARGTWEGKSSLKAGGYSSSDKGKWLTAFQRQKDGSWKAFWDIYNSDMPVAEALPLGREEMALLEIEREWAAAVVKTDVAWLAKTIADDFAANWNGRTIKKASFIADLKSGLTKTESMLFEDMRPLVFGEMAIVYGLSIEKATDRGKDTSGHFRWIDTFAKRDGRWQCVSSYSAKVS
jgi:ketosteroid isomerase-like protein